MGGAERQVLALAERMADRGHAVKLLVLRPQLKEQWPAALPVIHLDMRRTPLSVLRGFSRARRFLRGYRPDVVHGHSFHANLVARLLRAFAHAPVVLSTVHNVYEGGLHRMIAYRLTDFLCVRTTAVSTAAAERFVRLRAIPKRKCMVVANAIDIDQFAANPVRRAIVRSEMEAGTAFIWLTAGRLTPAKDIPNLMRGFALVQAAIPTAQLWIAGAGEPTPAQKNVHWLGLRRDMAALLDAADGFVLASAWEGMPLVLGEAMAMEKPVVATDVGGVRELVGDAGVVVPARDSAALAEAMLAVMKRSGDERTDLGRQARTRIAHKFNLDARADDWEKLYRSLIARSR
jgi:glycosyltransferase involved in cell wall biosynthesis